MTFSKILTSTKIFIRGNIIYPVFMLLFLLTFFREQIHSTDDENIDYNSENKPLPQQYVLIYIYIYIYTYLIGG